MGTRLADLILYCRVDAVLCSSRISQNVNEDEKGSWGRSGIKRAIYAVAISPEGGHTTKIVGMFAERVTVASKT